MKPPVETVRISQRGKEILINAKKRTGIDQWNILCRWALSASLAVETPPKPDRSVEESNIEIAWRVFGGQSAELLTVLLVARKKIDSKGSKMTDGEYFRAHLERGIGYLQNVKSLEQLCGWTSGFTG
jgi:DNA sulfur modification protein DndE